MNLLTLQRLQVLASTQIKQLSIHFKLQSPVAGL